MPIEKIFLDQILINAFPEAKIVVRDLVGDGDHYEATITSNIFKDKTRIQQHRIVNNALKDILGGDLHALSIITKTEV